MREPVPGIDGMLWLTAEAHRDERGFLAVLDVPPAGLASRYAVARTRYRGIIRGLHWRPGPGEAKVVQCCAGRMLDVAVDLRPGSPTYGNTASVVLSGHDQDAVYIPPGCAHGYQALLDGTLVSYRVDAAFDPEQDLEISWADPDLGISWPLPAHPASRRGPLSLAQVLKRIGSSL